jgi:hypothetical protein
MRTPQTVATLTLLGVLLAAGTASAEPILSDRVVITAADGKVIVDATRNESTPNLPELGISSGPLKVPHNAMNVNAGLILVDANNPNIISDWMRVRVFSGKKHDTLYITFKSNPDEKSLKLPADFPKGAPRIAETGQLQNVTAYLFPKYADAKVPPPFTVQVQSDLDKPDPAPAPEPASLALLGTGLLALGGYAWRRRRQAGRAAHG